MSSSKHILSITIFSILYIIIGCGILEISDSENQGTKAEIIPVESVERVSLGSSKQEVEAILGEFDLRNLACGLVRSWYTINFFGSGKSSMDGLNLFFIEESGENGVGPLDAFFIKAPYDGKTVEGIGIGSSPVFVLKAYGEPVKIDTTNSYKFTYCFRNGRHFIINFRDNAATSISMGYYRPMPEEYRICD